MAVSNTEEFAGKSKAQQKALVTFLDALKLSQDYCRERFETGVRMYRLFAGKTPPEIQGTFSQVMLWFPYSIIARELASSMKSMVEGGNWLDVTATDYRLEPTADVAKKWLLHQMQKVQQFQRTAIPTMQSSYIFGNGYRFYGHQSVSKERTEAVPVEGLMGVMEDVEDRVITEQKGLITGHAMNFFNGLPAPTGGVLNPPADTLEVGMPYFIANLYPPRSFIEAEVEKGNFNPREAARMFGQKMSDPHEDPSAEWKEQVADARAGWNQFTEPEWIAKMRHTRNDLPQRYLTSWFFQRDKWTIVGQQRFVLYDGPPMLDFWPVANFKHSYNLGEHFGFSLLETVEDLIISMILNFNMRLDYLAGQFHPPRYVPQRLLDDLGGDKKVFDWTPYKVLPYAHTAYPGGVGAYLHTEQMPDLPQQAFMEQGQMKEYLEDVISQHGAQSLNANTATVGAMLGSEDAAPKMLRAITNEMTGVQDSADMTLRFGAKFMNEDEIVRTARDGLPWEKIDHNAITDGYGIEITGARHLAQAEEMFKKQLSIAPLVLQNPNLKGQLELNKQLLEQAGFKHVDVILHGEPGELPQAGAPGQMPGGVPSLQNDTRSTMNRSTRNAAGRDVAAMAAAV